MNKQKNRPYIIAVDFDGTLCENAWPEIGQAKIGVLAAVKQAQEAGAKLILWTNRVGARLHDAIEWCAMRGLYFDAVNENLPETKAQYITDCRKICANIYLDDKALAPTQDALGALVRAAEQAAGMRGEGEPEGAVRARRAPEATIVTTLTVTHIIRDCETDEAVKLAEIIAYTAAETLAEAYSERVLPQGQPDNIAVSQVQVFGFDGSTEVRP